MSSLTAHKKPSGENATSSQNVYLKQQFGGTLERIGYQSSRKDESWRRNVQEKQEAQGRCDRGERGKFPYMDSQKKMLGFSNALQFSSLKGGSATNGQSFPPSPPTYGPWNMPIEGDTVLFGLNNSTLDHEYEVHRRKHSIVSPPSPPSIPLCRSDPPPSIPSGSLQSIPHPSSSQYTIIPSASEHFFLPFPVSSGDCGQARFSENCKKYVNEIFASPWVSAAALLVPDGEAGPPSASRLAQWSQGSERSECTSLYSCGLDSEEFRSPILSSSRPSHVTTVGLEGGIKLAETVQLNHSHSVHDNTNSVVTPPPGLTSNPLPSTHNSTDLEQFPEKFHGLVFERALTHRVECFEGGVHDGDVIQQSGLFSMNGNHSAELPPPPPGLVTPKQQKMNKKKHDISSSIISSDNIPPPVQSSIPQQEQNSVEEMNFSEPPQPSTTSLQHLSSTSSTPRQQQQHPLQESSSKAVDIMKILGLVPPVAKGRDAEMLEPISTTTQGDRGSQKFAFHTHHRYQTRATSLNSSFKPFRNGHHPEKITAQKSSSEPKPMQQQYINRPTSCVPHQLLKRML